MTARQKIVDLLVEKKLVQMGNDKNFLRHILSSGFPGFINMSDNLLRSMVREAGLESQDGMGLLLQELSQQEPSLTHATRNEEKIARPVPVPAVVANANAESLLALAGEIRNYFQKEAAPPMVKLMIETLGPLAQSIRAEDNFKALDFLNAAQLRRLIPVSLSLRYRVRSLLAALEEHK